MRGHLDHEATRTLTTDMLTRIDAYWRAANYLSVGQIYLRDNPLLKRPAGARRRQAQAARALGHDAGAELHLRAPEPRHPRVRPRHDLHLRARATAARRWSPTPTSKAATARSIPTSARTRPGCASCSGSSRFRAAFPSHASPECPGSIHEGGELGYSLSHAFGAVFDNPDLIVACVIGDGEAETGPLATAWHSNKFLDPAHRRRGAADPASERLQDRQPHACWRASRARSWSSCCAATAGRRISSRATSRRRCTRRWRRRSTRRSTQIQRIQQRGARERRHARGRAGR